MLRFPCGGVTKYDFSERQFREGRIKTTPLSVGWKALETFVYFSYLEKAFPAYVLHIIGGYDANPRVCKVRFALLYVQSDSSP